MTQDTSQRLAAAIAAGDRIALARAITRVENQTRGSADLVSACTACARGAHRIGITGAPGAGKSTLVNAVIGELLGRGCSVAVVAVDPSSPLSGGAVLGDRVRMGPHADSERVFIRSMASRGHPGGLAARTRDVLALVDAAGFDVILVETVGAGQSEVDVMRVADTVIVASPPGLGDEVQAIKAGILEIGHVLVVTKGDLPQAERTARHLESALALRRPGPWKVPVVITSALENRGIGELVDAVERHRGAKRQTASAAG